MRHMKKIIACMVAGAAIMGLAACSYIPALTGLETEQSELELPVGASETVVYSALTEADGEDFRAPILHKVVLPELKVSFAATDSSIVSVDETGCVTGLAPGETSVTVTAGDGKTSFERSLPVVCFRYIDDLEKLPDALEIEAGKEYDLTEGFGRYDRWIALAASSDEKVALCDGPVIRAAGPGEAVVTLTLENKTKEVAVTGFQYLDSLKELPETLELDVGTKYNLMDCFGNFRRWNALSASSDEDVARCGGAVIEAAGPGDCTVTVTLEGETREISLHCRQPVKEFKLNHETLQGEEGSTASVAMESWLPEDANDGFELTYTSSDEKVAVVDAEGNVRLVAPGEAVISAENGTGARAECSVAVSKKKAAASAGTPGTTNPDDYDRSIPAVKAVLNMLGRRCACTDVAEAAAQAQGRTAWTHTQYGSYYVSLLTPEGFLDIGKTVPYSKVQPGDILYYEDGGLGFSHVAVYIGKGMAVHGNYGSDHLAKIASATYVTPTYVIHIS